MHIGIISFLAAMAPTVFALAVGPSGGITARSSNLVPRDNTNVVVDLASDFNKPQVLSLIDQNLPSGVSRSSGIQLAWMPWGNVPGPVKPRAKNPHADTDPVIRISMRVHVNTPWWCLAVDGSIIYYLFPDNSGLLIKAVIDSWDTLTDNISACQSSVNDQLRAAVPTKYSVLQGLVDFRLSQLPNEHFGSFQLLPVWTGSVQDNAHVQLVLERDTIVSRWSNLCMDVRQASTASGALVQQYTCNETGAQKFDKFPFPSPGANAGFFTIKNRNSAKCLGISDGSTANGALVVQLNCDPADLTQHWKSVDPGTGNTVGAKWLINRKSGRCVEVPGWSSASGTLLAQADCVGGWKDYWYNLNV